jgi:hypothetical protein
VTKLSPFIHDRWQHQGPSAVSESIHQGLDARAHVRSLRQNGISQFRLLRNTPAKSRLYDDVGCFACLARIQGGGIDPTLPQFASFRRDGPHHSISFVLCRGRTGNQNWKQETKRQRRSRPSFVRITISPDRTSGGSVETIMNSRIWSSTSSERCPQARVVQSSNRRSSSLK